MYFKNVFGWNYADIVPRTVNKHGVSFWPPRHMPRPKALPEQQCVSIVTAVARVEMFCVMVLTLILVKHTGRVLEGWWEGRGGATITLSVCLRGAGRQNELFMNGASLRLLLTSEVIMSVCVCVCDSSSGIESSMFVMRHDENSIADRWENT